MTSIKSLVGRWHALIWLGLPACQAFSFDEGNVDCEPQAQNEYAKALMKDVYLWADSTPDVDPARFDSPGALVLAMRNAQDHWSGVSAAAPRRDFFEKGEYFGIGYQAIVDNQNQIRVSFVHPGSPADLAGMARGDVFLEINGKTIQQIYDENLWASIEGPNERGFAVPFKVKRTSGEVADLTVVKDTVVVRTVAVSRLIGEGDQKVLYLLFSGFLGTSDRDLREALASYRPLGVEKVVLDLRYNGGGFVSVATDLASMLVGEPGVGVPFSILAYNERYRSKNVTTPLHQEEVSLTVKHLVGLTGPGTASASELLLNGLHPIIDTKLVGAPTHGKPVGGSTWAHCELAISPITFRTLNGQGQGDYFGGLMPDCNAPDDLDHELGDPEEARLKAALALLRGEACPEPVSADRELQSLRRTPAHGVAPITRGPQDPFGMF